MYGLLISIAILSCILVAERLVIKDEKNPDIIWDLSLISIISGIIGARIYYVLDNLKYFSQNPLQSLYIWNGGLGIYGAIIFGFISIYIYLHLKKLNSLYYISIITMVLPLGQAIGRWGNYFNQELYGIKTTMPWGIIINNTKYHPLFLYESILNLLLFFTLLKIRSYKSTTKIIGIYLGGYALIRFLLEFLKDNTIKFYYLSTAQYVSIILLIISFIIIVKKESVQ